MTAGERESVFIAACKRSIPLISFVASVYVIAPFSKNMDISEEISSNSSKLM
ncbi:MAG: hypothetical protein K6A79_11350 [Ruminococcus sp.]|nr:hypothetical protein [Ruminococcus sp.]